MNGKYQESIFTSTMTPWSAKSCFAQPFERFSLISFGAGSVVVLGYVAFEALARPALAISKAIEP